MSLSEEKASQIRNELQVIGGSLTLFKKTLRHSDTDGLMCNVCHKYMKYIFDSFEKIKEIVRKE